MLKLTKNTRFSDEELFEFCLANRDLRIERDKDDNLIITSPSGCNTSRINFRILGQFFGWTSKNETLGTGFDSEGGFLLPDGSMRAADVAWMSHERWGKLTEQEKNKFAPAVPDFVIELKSPSDTLKSLKGKMTEWIGNGVRLGWLIDPGTETAYIFKQGREPKAVESFDNFLDGEDVLPGFKLDLSKLKV